MPEESQFYTRRFRVERNNQNRLDLFLKEYLSRDFTRHEIKEAILTGGVRVNQAVVKRPAYVLAPHQEILVRIPLRPRTLEPWQPPFRLDPLYEDDHLVIFNKPAGLLSTPTRYERRETVVSLLLNRYKKLPYIDNPLEQGLVHRLDQKVSGVLVCVKTQTALNSLHRQFKERKVHKEYRALVSGQASFQEKTVDAAITPYRRTWKMKVFPMDHPSADSRTKTATTHVHTLRTFPDYSYFQLIPETGRSHQIRAHCAHIGHPILGDDLYQRPGVREQGSGDREKESRDVQESSRRGVEESSSPAIIQHPPISYQLPTFLVKLKAENAIALHAYAITFSHPLTQKELSITAPLPSYFFPLIPSEENKKMKHYDSEA